MINNVGMMNQYRPVCYAKMEPAATCAAKRSNGMR